MLMVAGLAWLAFEGASRKTPLAGAGESVGHLAASSLTGFGGLLAIAGGILFVLLAGRALWRGGPFATNPPALLSLDAPPELATASGARRRDVRPRAILLTALAVVALGLAFAYLPDPGSLRELAARSLAGFDPVDKPSHAADKRREEVDLRFAQGVVMLHAKEYEHAFTAFHRVIELSPEMPEAHVNMGYALIGLGRFAPARDFFETAITLRRDQLNAYYGLAEAFEGLNDIPAAIGAMRTYVHLAPPDDAFRRKGESALWEWQDRLARERTQKPAPSGPAPASKRPPSQP
jgi:tetratricopeptide (TPR) repeat protein